MKKQIIGNAVIMIDNRKFKVVLTVNEEGNIVVDGLPSCHYEVFEEEVSFFNLVESEKEQFDNEILD